MSAVNWAEVLSRLASAGADPDEGGQRLASEASPRRRPHGCRAEPRMTDPRSRGCARPPAIWVCRWRSAPAWRSRSASGCPYHRPCLGAASDRRGDSPRASVGGPALDSADRNRVAREVGVRPRRRALPSQRAVRPPACAIAHPPHACATATSRTPVSTARHLPSRPKDRPGSRPSGPLHRAYERATSAGRGQRHGRRACCADRLPGCGGHRPNRS